MNTQEDVMARKNAERHREDAVYAIEQMWDLRASEVRRELGRTLAKMTPSEIVECGWKREISDDFLLGLKFAAELVGDLDFDY
jgi:hypothetical protein